MPKTVSLDDSRVVKATDKAVLVEYEGEEYWLPRSQIVVEESEVYDVEGDHGTLVITEWIAQQKGLVP